MKNKTIFSRLLFFCVLSGLIFFVVSCKEKTTNVLIPNFDSIENIAGREPNLSSLIDSCRIVKLETSEQCLMGTIKKIIKKRHCFFIKTYDDELFVFDNNGNYLRKIGKKGKGPGEFLRIQDFDVNEDGTVVTICCLTDIYFYNVNDGSFIGKQSFENSINNIFYLPGNEILARIVHADSLIAHIDADGKIVTTFGIFTRGLELGKPFEFVSLDNSNVMYKVAQTSDFYQYNFKEKTVARKQILESEHVLREQSLHEELMASGPDSDYRFAMDYLKKYYKILDVKMLKSNLLVEYFYKDNYYITLYSPEQNKKQEFIFYPEKTGTLQDDVLFLRGQALISISRTGSDDNTVVAYINAAGLLSNFKKGIPDGLKQSEYYDEMKELLDTLNDGDNPVLIEYVFNEI